MEEMIKEILNTVKGLKSQQDAMKSQQDAMKSQQDENTQILKALEERTKVNGAEINKIQHDIAELMGDVKEIKKDITVMAINISKNTLDINLIKQANQK